MALTELCIVPHTGIGWTDFVIRCSGKHLLVVKTLQIIRK